MHKARLISFPTLKQTISWSDYLRYGLACWSSACWSIWRCHWEWIPRALHQLKQCCEALLALRHRSSPPRLALLNEGATPPMSGEDTGQLWAASQAQNPAMGRENRRTPSRPVPRIRTSPLIRCPEASTVISECVVGLRAGWSSRENTSQIRLPVKRNVIDFINFQLRFWLP